MNCDLASGTWCIGMDRVLQPAGRTKGLSLFEMFNSKTFTSRIVGVVYRTSAHDKGLILNRCPWCGAWLNDFREDDRDQADGVGR